MILTYQKGRLLRNVSVLLIFFIVFFFQNVLYVFRIGSWFLTQNVELRGVDVKPESVEIHFICFKYDNGKKAN